MVTLPGGGAGPQNAPAYPRAGSEPLPPVPDHPGLEREIIAWWEERRIFERLREQTKGAPKWRFVDGPITANNPMGVHHGWGRTLKDVFQRFQALQGHELRYQNGFDCQGLWVEVEVEKSLGLNSKREIEEYGLAEFARRCRERVAEFSEVQTRQSIRLGMWVGVVNDDARAAAGERRAGRPAGCGVRPRPKRRGRRVGGGGAPRAAARPRRRRRARAGRRPRPPTLRRAP